MIEEMLGRSSWGVILATRHSPAELIAVLGLLLVIACLAGAAYLAYLRNAVGAVLLLLVAIVAAFLLL